jgi:cell wall-associated NlpC family hydrolase
MSNPQSPWTAEAIEAAEIEALRWEGTPHRDRMAKIGSGIDCLFLLREIAVAAGVLPPFEFPFYNPAWGLGRRNNLIGRILNLTTFCQTLPPDTTLQDGDVLIFAVGRQSNHCAMFIKGRVWHATANRFVTGETMEEALQAPLQAVIRITAPGFKRRPETLTQEEFKA